MHGDLLHLLDDRVLELGALEGGVHCFVQAEGELGVALVLPLVLEVVVVALDSALQVLQRLVESPAGIVGVLLRPQDDAVGVGRRLHVEIALMKADDHLAVQDLPEELLQLGDLALHVASQFVVDLRPSLHKTYFHRPSPPFLR